MEGVSGLSLISPHQRNALKQMIKVSEEAASLYSQAATFGLQHMIPSGVSLSGGVGDISSYGIPFGFPPRPQQGRLPSPVSPSNRHDAPFESDRKGK